jgi:hypothetical protein
VVGAVLTLPVAILGSHWPPIAPHALIDLGAGTIRWLASREGSAGGDVVAMEHLATPESAAKLGSLTTLEDEMTKATPLLALLVILAAPLSAQPATASINVKLPSGTERVVTAAALAALPRVSGQVSFHGKLVHYEGADLRDVLRAAGVTPLDSLRGSHLRRVVLFVGADGYAAAVALSELDPSIGGRQAVLVDREDGAALVPDIGPYRIVIVGDRRPSRWVRQLVAIEVRDLR